MADETTVLLGFGAGAAPNEAMEHEAAEWFDAHPDQRPELFDAEGSVYMLFESEEARFCDQMATLVWEVCFDMPIRMTETDLATFSLQNYETAGQFRLDGDEIEVASNVFNPVRFPAGPLLHALIDAGERYIQLAERLWPEVAEEILPGYRIRATEARERVNNTYSLDVVTPRPGM